jgi:hypothetical protein
MAHSLRADGRFGVYTIAYAGTNGDAPDRWIFTPKGSHSRSKIPREFVTLGNRINTSTTLSLINTTSANGLWPPPRPVTVRYD